MGSIQSDIEKQKKRRQPVFAAKAVSGVDSVDPDELLSAVETAERLKQKPQTLAAWRSAGKGPEYLVVGRNIYYRRASIGAFLAASIVIPHKT